MRQRIVGAIGISCEPRLLIADEPTTSLDLTIQAQYLNLLRDLQREHGLALIFITHNLGIVAKMCDQLAVMYAGRVVEYGPVSQHLQRPGPPLHRGAAELDPAHERRPPAADRDRRPAARSVGAAAGLLLRAALPAGLRPLPRRGAAGVRAGRGPHGALLAAPTPSPTSAASCAVAAAEQSDGGSRSGRAQQAFPGQARRVRRRPRRRARGRRHLVRDRARADPRRRRRVRLRQDDDRQARARARGADRRHHALRGQGSAASSTPPAGGTTANRCRRCSRTRTPRSTRACGSARSSPSRSITNEKLTGARGAPARARAARPGRAAGARGRAVPARVLRRAAAAHRDRPGARRCRRS